MSTDALDPLLKLPASERAQLALALWESLDDAEREAAAGPLTPEQLAEFERRTAAHVADPGSAVPWTQVQRKLRDPA